MRYSPPEGAKNLTTDDIGYIIIRVPKLFRISIVSKASSVIGARFNQQPVIAIIVRKISDKSSKKRRITLENIA